jgi:predicted amidophosphoribosyltransferase
MRATRAGAAVSLGRVDPHRLGSLLVPPRCVACSAATAPTQNLCRRCDRALAAGLQGSSTLAIGGERLAVHWACDYAGVALDLVRALKFGRRISAAAAIATVLAPLVPRGVAVIPVPAAPWRRRVRGFDPAEEIALALARQTGLEVVQCLRRGRGRRQVGRSRADRLADPPQIRLAGSPPTPVVLVDDVFTTGATLAACARALDGAAATAYVFARARGTAGVAYGRSI